MAKVAPKDVKATIEKHMIKKDTYDFVVDMEKSHGSYIVDAKDPKREYLDFYSCFASAPLGYNHKDMLNGEFLKKLQWCAVHNITNSDLDTEYKAEFVQSFYATTAPKYMGHMFMVAGGGLAVENALKAAFDWKVQTNRQRGDTRGLGTKVMHLTGAFHGRTGYTMSLTNTDPVKTEMFPKFDWPRVAAPYVEFPDTGKAHEDLLKREALAIAQVKWFIKTEGADIAAFIMEPIQGEGGDRHFRPEFAQAMQTLCRENDIMFIVDEVQTGVGLTGKMWAFEHLGVEPDMLVFGKKMQVCGFLCSNRIDSVKQNVFVKSSRINSTWGGNLVDMVRAQRYLEIIHNDKLVDNAAKTGELLKAGLTKLAKQHPNLLLNVRGRGLMCALDATTVGKRDELKEACYKEGLLVLPCGERSIRFRPALNLSPDEVKEGMGLLEKALKKI